MEGQRAFIHKRKAVKTLLPVLLNVVLLLVMPVAAFAQQSRISDPDI